MIALLGALWVEPSRAADLSAEIHGDVKSFAIGSVPYRWFVLPDEIADLQPGSDPDEILAFAGYGSDPVVQGIADLRLKATLRGPTWRIEGHHAISALPGSGGGLSAVGGASAGVGLTAPELFPLTWQPDIGNDMTLRGRTDRLLFSLSLPHAGITVGRQPITFGTGLAFTPMDVVNPFSPATIDSEYKPGVDALRGDIFWGMAGQASLVAAWVGSPDPFDKEADEVGIEDLVFAGHAQATVGVTDIHGLAGDIRGDIVLGTGIVTAINAIGIHSDVTFTVPGGEAIEEDPFVRWVFGGEGRPTTTTTIAVEGYLQTLGAKDESGYFEALSNPRFARGELWLLGRTYASLSVMQEITPLVSASGSLIANLGDPSGLLVPSLSWSVADNATVGLGGYLALGQRPEEVALAILPDPAAPTDPSRASLAPSPGALEDSLRSEFGLYPHAWFLQMRAYF